jgi:phosphoribosylaminoimidazole-succinocarboxamide synthase
VCGIALPAGLAQADRLPEPIFTPSTKAAVGAHDENIDFKQMAELIGADLATQVRDVSLALYESAAEYALTRGIIIADTKFEFGLDEAGKTGVDRRGPDPRFVALLAGRPVPARRQSAELRQAVRPRLARVQRLEQAGPRPGTAARHRRQDRRKIPRGDDAAAGLKV